ncbi:hypothetical protein [Sphingomonas sp. BAUL-RG-20F-R05-02]|nr:hypothetical protein [Sphingomonas sp. BAUL-RG-20F-R05-02]
MIFPFGWVESQISILYVLVGEARIIAVQQFRQTQRTRARMHETNANPRS